MLDRHFPQLFSIYTWRMSTAFIFCTLFSSILIWVILLVETQSAESKFNLEVHTVYSQLLHELNANKTVISALSGWQHSHILEYGSELRAFSKDILESYPQLASIYYMKRVTEKERPDFEARMREDGYATFQITQKSRNSIAQLDEKKTSYFPITFIEPFEPDTAGVLGYDALSDKEFAKAIREATESGKEVIAISPDFYRQGASLVIFKAVYKGKILPQDVESRHNQIKGVFVVSILVEDLKPFLLDMLNGSSTNISLLHNTEEMSPADDELLFHPLSNESQFDLSMFPTFDTALDMSSAGQPIVLRVWRKAGFADYDFKLPVGIFLFYITVLILIRVSLKGDLKHSIAAEIAKDEIFKEKELAEVTLHSIVDGVITADINNNIDYMNEVAEKLTGWRSEESKNLALNKVFDIRAESQPKETSLIFDQSKLNSDVGELSESYFLQRKDGTQYTIKISASRIRNRSGDIVGTIIVFRNVTSERKMAQLMAHQARHDELTGLYNRREFEFQLKRSIECNEKNKLCDVLCYLDLDQFKLVNDTCGHIAGDKLLTQITHILKHNTRESDVLARLGGDEFGLIVKNCSIEKAFDIATVLHNAIKAFHFSWEGKVFSIGSSMGLVKISAEIGSITEVMSAADSACYMAKDKGRNRIYAHTMNDQELLSRHGEMQWVHKINDAFENQRFRLYRQVVEPLLDHSNPRHYEVLIRMEDEFGKIIPPMAFIPAAERYNVMPAIDRWVIKQSFALMSEEQNAELIYNINLSGKSINEEGFLEFVIAEIRINDIPTKNICFEITETAAISNLNSAAEFINILKQHGCTFALDDFGSGLSSFSYLKNLPVDYLKIDGSFVKDLMDDAIDRAMVSSIAQVGRVMGIKTIAEFVENGAIKKQLTKMDVDYAQGYGVARPEEWIVKPSKKQ